MKEKTAEITFVCPAWLSFMLDFPFRRMIHDPEKLLKEYLKNGDTAIDLGCGSGFFTIPMARMVGPSGRVIAVDLQEKMLEKVRKKAKAAGVMDRIGFHRCNPEKSGVREKADFILAFFMVHETPDPVAFLQEIKELLTEKGKLLIVEPVLHVTKKNFNRLLQLVEAAGFKILDRPAITGGRAVLVSL